MVSIYSIYAIDKEWQLVSQDLETSSICVKKYNYIEL